MTYREHRRLYDKVLVILKSEAEPGLESSSRWAHATRRMRYVLSAVAILVGGFLAIPVGLIVSSAEFLESMEITALTMKGWKLSAKEVAPLEEELLTNPENMSIRGRLLGYYSAEQFESEIAREAHARNVLWLIEHRPRHALPPTVC